MPDNVIQLANQFRNALERQDAASLNRLINAYGNLYNRLQDKIDLLSRDIAEQEPTRGQLVQMQRYKELIAQVAKELRSFQVFTKVEIESQSTASISRGVADSSRLMQVSAKMHGISAVFNRLPTSAIKTALGFLKEDGPLFKRLEQLAPVTAQYVSDQIVNSIGLGYNPRKTARLITDALGSGLTDALRMTRTVQLYSYREAARANYVANDDVIEGWVWSAELDESTCPSCIAQHGSVHPLSEPLNDHHNGRCAAIPLVIGGSNPVKETGEDWFSNLSEAEQKAIMGQGRHEAFKAGKFEFGALSGVRDDEVYGPMRVAASLKELV